MIVEDPDNPALNPPRQCIGQNADARPGSHRELAQSRLLNAIEYDRIRDRVVALGVEHHAVMAAIAYKLNDCANQKNTLQIIADHLLIPQDRVIEILADIRRIRDEEGMA